MKNFKKTEKYSIVAYVEDYETIRTFAIEEEASDTTTEIRFCGELFMVTFYATETKEDIINKLKNKFKHVSDLSTMNNGLIFVKDEP